MLQHCSHQRRRPCLPFLPPAGRQKNGACIQCGISAVHLRREHLEQKRNIHSKKRDCAMAPHATLLNMTLTAIQKRQRLSLVFVVSRCDKLRTRPYHSFLPFWRAVF